MAFDATSYKPNGLNVAEILRVADLVEKSETFDMTVYHRCGTPACIAGHATAMSRGAEFLAGDADGGKTHVAATEILGLNDRAAISLFAPSAPILHDITNAHAAACLRKLAETGEVDWLGTKPAQTGAAS